MPRILQLFYRPLLILFLAFALGGCYEPEVGCLDARATNFSLDADEACNDCCTFPQLKVRFTHRWETTDTSRTLLLNGVYEDALGQAFRIQRLRFYWSAIQLDRFGEVPLIPSDSVIIGYVEDNDTTLLTVADNFALANAGSSPTTASLGEVQPAGTVVGLQSIFGIRDPANRAAVTSLPTGHPLGPQPGRMNLGAELGYLFAKLELFRDTVATDTVPLVLHLYGQDFLRDLNLSLSPGRVLVEGFTPIALVQVNYAQWFAGIDIRSTDTTSMKQQIVNNLTQSFTFTDLIPE